jgi:WD40 repeat protein
LLVHTDAQALQILDVASLTAGHQFVLESNMNVFPMLSPDGRFLAYRSSLGPGRYFRVYSATGEAVYTAEKWVPNWAFSPDSRLLAVSDSVDDTLLLKDMAGSIERRVAGCAAVVLAFSPDGFLLAAGTYSGVNLVDIATARVAANLKGHQTMVTAVAFSPDGKTLASGAKDRTIRLYNVATRRQVAVLSVSSVVFSLAFSPDGQTLVSSEAPDETGPGHYRFWYAPRVDAPPLPLPALHAPAPDSIWVTASKLKNAVQPAGANP